MNCTEKIIYRVIIIFLNLLGLIPLTWLRKLGRLIGRLFFLIDKRHRNLTIENLTHAFGREKNPGEIRNIACKVFENLMQIPFEMTLIPKLQRKDLGSLITVEGLHHLQAAYQKGKGILCLGAHVGNWELIPAVLSLLGYPPESIARPLDFKPLDIFISKLRTWHGGDIIPKKSSMRRILKSLKQGKLVGVLLDQNAHRYDGVFVDYFGRPASTTKGLALLALKTGAPIVPMFLVRNGSHYKMWCAPEVPLTRTGDKSKDIETNTQLYTKMIESTVRRYPDQWFWLHRRWRTRPIGRIAQRAESKRVNL
jgi:KDO2-lipid IV(A) lauroyltransferase